MLDTSDRSAFLELKFRLIELTQPVFINPGTSVTSVMFCEQHNVRRAPAFDGGNGGSSSRHGPVRHGRDRHRAAVRRHDTGVAGGVGGPPGRGA